MKIDKSKVIETKPQQIKVGIGMDILPVIFICIIIFLMFSYF